MCSVAAQALWDLDSFILPGSKRLLTEHGMFGSNVDVLPPQAAGMGGPVFEMLLPLARRRQSVAASAPGARGVPAATSHLLSMFANMAIRQLIDAPEPQMRVWFEQHAAAEPLRLHRGV